MKRASSEALEDDLCATCGHYHARGTTCDECGHVRRGEEDAGASASSGTEGPMMTTMREPSPQEVARRTCPVEIFERFCSWVRSNTRRASAISRSPGCGR